MVHPLASGGVAPSHTTRSGEKVGGRASRFGGPFGALVVSLLLLAPPALAATSHGLVVGIDTYSNVQQLRGAVADAKDVAAGLRRIGVSDVRMLLDAQANRASMLAALEDISSGSRPGDTVYIVLAGHGAQEPERVRGSEPDGMDEVFLLQPFDPRTPDGASEKILDKEFNHYIKRIEANGARAVFVADTCSGGGLARSVDARAANDMIYRSVIYTPIKDNLVSVATRADSYEEPADFKRSLFLAAVDKASRVPELKIPGVGYRGGRSYAFARALEGAADLDGDGRITADELFTYVRQVAHQLSDQRQKVVLIAPDGVEPKKLVVAERTRGIDVRPVGAPAAPAGGLTILPADGDDGAGGTGLGAATSAALQPAGAVPPSVVLKDNSAASPPQGSKPSSAPAATAPLPDLPFPSAPSPGIAATGSGSSAPVPFRPAGAPIRLASLDGKSSWFADVGQAKSVVVVPPSANPDLVFDPGSRDVLAGPDVVARNVDPSDLPGVVEHSLIMDWLKTRSAKGTQPIKLLPGDDVHSKGTRIEINVEQLTNRYLVLFNVSGNGNVQLLYPLGSDAPQRLDPTYSVEFQVREPYGSDDIVAVTASARMGELERLLKQSSRRLPADRLAEVMNRSDVPGVRVGYVGLYTTP